MRFRDKLRDFIELMYWTMLGKHDELPVEFEDDTSFTKWHMGKILVR